MRWSSNLAYSIGLITTDGSMSKDGRHISLTSKDLEQIENIAKALNLKNKISKKRSGYITERKYFVIQFGNKTLYNFLLSIGLHPNKTKSLSSLKIPTKYFADFLRGHLDGDGFTHSYWDKRWKSSFMLYTGFSSGSKLHLEWLRNKISELFQIEGKIKYVGKSTYHLIFAKQSSLVLIKKMYYKKDVLCLQRKRFKIEQSLGIIQSQAGMLKLADRHA
jgi:hypothetical protein